MHGHKLAIGGKFLIFLHVNQEGHTFNPNKVEILDPDISRHLRNFLAAGHLE